MKAEEFYLSVKKSGVNFGSGVPCAVLKKLFYCFLKDPEMPYVAAAREEDAIGIATGAFLAGKVPIVLMQNSGLANSINALASLCIPYEIQMLLLVSWRGCPEIPNEPAFHHVMGRSTIPILNQLEIPVQVISRENPELAILNSMEEMKKRKRPSVMLLKRGVLE